MGTSVKIRCICGKEATLIGCGNKNADYKGQCACGRHLTVHFRWPNNKWNRKLTW